MIRSHFVSKCACADHTFVLKWRCFFVIWVVWLEQQANSKFSIVLFPIYSLLTYRLTMVFNNSWVMARIVLSSFKRLLNVKRSVLRSYYKDETWTFIWRLLYMYDYVLIIIDNNYTCTCICICQRKFCWK